MRVTGTFTTKYGPCRFSMENAKKANVSLGPEREDGITLNRVQYIGVLAIQKYDDKWVAQPYNSNVRRADGVKITGHTNSYFKLMEDLEKDWTAFINDPKNAGVLTLAAFSKVANDREKYLRDISAAEEKVVMAKNGLAAFDAINVEERRALKMAVEKVNIPGVKLED